MFKFNRKSIIHSAVFVVSLLFISSLVPVFNPPVSGLLKYPIIALNLIKREVGGVVFFHRNLMQNESFRRENDILKNKLNQADEIFLENARLSKLLGFKEKSSFMVLACRVIATSADNWSSGVIIDKGSSSGIKKGYVVINYLGLVGRVVEVSGSTSKVMLVSDPNLGVSAICQRSRQEGLVSGTLGTSLVMKYLPKDADIKISDSIMSSGLTEAYPKGLLIGTVIDTAEEPSGLSRYAIIKPAVNLSNLEEVLVIVP